MGKILPSIINEYTNIYALVDPRINEIRYIGKTDRPKLRLNEHIRKAKYSRTHKNNQILSDVVNANECGFGKQYWIDLFRTWGFNLTNIAFGGVCGNLGIAVNNKISQKLKGRTFSNETINKMRIRAKNRKLSDVGRKSLSEHRSGSGSPMYGKHRPESSKKYRNIVQLYLDSNIIEVWCGITTASKELNINRCTISDVCNKRKNTAGGYKWKYV